MTKFVASPFCAALAFVIASPPLHPRQLIRLGAEFQVASYTPGAQSDPATAMGADGDFVVAWRSVHDGSSTGVFARRFNAAGVAQAAEFQVNSHTTNFQESPAVAMNALGHFVVAWQSTAQDGSSVGIFARRFNAAGVAQAAEFQVNSYTTSPQSRPAVAMDGDGGFAITWASNGQDGASSGVFARRFDAAGIAQAVELQVNSYTTSNQFDPAVAMDSDGDFVVAWRSYGQDGSPFGFGIFARRFDAAGAAQAAEFQVNSYTAGTQSLNAMAMDADGDFVVAWESLGQDGSGYGVFAQRFDSAGAAHAAEFQVNSYTTNSQFSPAVAMDGGGDFVIAWQSSAQDGSGYGVFARHFDPAGAAQAAEFQVNSFTTAYQYRPTVAMDAGGHFVIAWSSSGQDGPSYGVFAQRFATLALLDIDGNGSTEALTDGLLLLRFLFGFTSDSLVNAAIDAVDCTRCNAPAIEAYLISTLDSTLPTRRGGEFQVNSYTSDHQSRAAVAMDGDGDFVVAWISGGQDGSDFGVFARRFNAAGIAQAAEFQVNSHTTNDQEFPELQMDGDGDFVVAWDSVQGGSGVFARRFDSAGAAQAAEFQINSYTPGVQGGPAMAMGADGFVVVWSSAGQDGSFFGAFARRFDSTGAALAMEFQVNSYTTNDQSYTAVARDADGDFVVAWTSGGQDGDSLGVSARRFNSTGIALAAEFQVNSYTTGGQFRPSVAMHGNGDFVIVWHSSGQDGSDFGVFARRFNAAGVAQAAEFQVNIYTSDSQGPASVAMDADGEFVVAWGSYRQDGSRGGIFARRFNSAGVAQAREFQVNSYTTQAQLLEAVASDPGGGFVVAWRSYDQDGSSYGVFAQRFAVLGVFDVDGNGAMTALTDGLLVLRFLFGFTGDTLISGVIDTNSCTRCDAPAVEAYLATLI
jgi:hypothetical protein